MTLEGPNSKAHHWVSYLLIWENRVLLEGFFDGRRSCVGWGVGIRKLRRERQIWVIVPGSGSSFREICEILGGGAECQLKSGSLKSPR